MAPLRNGTPRLGAMDNGRPAPMCVRIYRPSLHNVYYATRFWAPEHWTLAPRAPRSTAARTAAPTRRCTAAPLHRSTAAPQHRCTAPRITPHRHQHPRAPRAARPAPPPMGGSESRRHGRGGVVRGGLPYAYREKRHFPDAGSYTSPIYKPNTRPLCAQYAPICAQYAPICAQYAPICVCLPLSLRRAFYFPRKAQKIEK